MYPLFENGPWFGLFEADCSTKTGPIFCQNTKKKLINMDFATSFLRMEKNPDAWERRWKCCVYAAICFIRLWRTYKGSKSVDDLAVFCLFAAHGKKPSSAERGKIIHTELFQASCFLKYQLSLGNNQQILSWVKCCQIMLSCPPFDFKQMERA